MNAMQAPTPKSSVHRHSRIPELEKLGVRYNTMLRFRHGGQLMVMSHFFPHSGNKCDLERVRPGGTSVRLSNM
jgi:hypothetical protein